MRDKAEASSRVSEASELAAGKSGHEPPYLGLTDQGGQSVRSVSGLPTVRRQTTSNADDARHFGRRQESGKSAISAFRSALLLVSA